MLRWVFLFAITLVISGCTSTPSSSTMDKGFYYTYKAFLNSPSEDGLKEVQTFLTSKKANTDSYLKLYRNYQKLGKRTTNRIFKNLKKGDVLTVRSLIAMAFDFQTNEINKESRDLASEILADEKGIGLKKPRTALFLLGIPIAHNYPGPLLQALAAEKEYRPPKEWNRIFHSIMNYGLKDPHFDPKCTNCPYSSEFFSRKFKKLTQAPVQGNVANQIQNWIPSTKLGKSQKSPVKELHQALFKPSDSSLSTLRQACYYASRPEDPKPSVEDLDESTSKWIVRQLEKGNLYVARVLVILGNRGCWQELDNFDGPASWLSSTLLCKNPETFVKALSLEKADSFFLENLIEYDNRERWIFCGENPGDSKADLVKLKIDKINSVTENIEAADRIKSYLSEKYSPKRLPTSQENN